MAERPVYRSAVALSCLGVMVASMSAVVVFDVRGWQMFALAVGPVVVAVAIGMLIAGPRRLRRRGRQRD